MKLLSKKLLTKIKKREDALIIMQINDWCNSNETNQKKYYYHEGYYWTNESQKELSKKLDIPLRSLERSMNRISSYGEDSYLIKSRKHNKSDDNGNRVWYRPNYPYICKIIGQEFSSSDELESGLVAFKPHFFRSSIDRV